MIAFGEPGMRDSVTIGRSNDNDIRANDISVSRCHAYIRYDQNEGIFVLEDNQSKFGTLV